MARYHLFSICVQPCSKVIATRLLFILYYVGKYGDHWDTFFFKLLFFVFKYFYRFRDISI